MSLVVILKWEEDGAVKMIFKYDSLFMVIFTNSLANIIPWIPLYGFTVPGYFMFIFILHFLVCMCVSVCMYAWEENNTFFDNAVWMTIIFYATKLYK